MYLKQDRALEVLTIGGYLGFMGPLLLVTVYIYYSHVLCVLGYAVKEQVKRNCKKVPLRAREMNGRK